MVEVKFCGLTRAEDAAMAAALGARYGGAVFAGGPRRLDLAGAQAMFAGLDGSDVGRVGVFGAQPLREILAIAAGARLDVLQLHDGASADRLLELRRAFGGAVWAVVPVEGTRMRAPEDSVLALVDAVVVDAAVQGRSGGTGVTFDWGAAAPAVRSLGVRRPVVLAGGLRPANVAEAVRVLQPRVVDVSSGVERAPGIKDHATMRAFAEAARSREGE